jgi:thiol-disulfide isomerase/thioredoxin
MKSTTLLLIILILIIAIPTGSAKIVSAVEDFSTYVGYAGVTNADVKEEEKVPEKVQQKCGGTGFIKSGDGIVDIPCPGCEDCKNKKPASTKCNCGCGKENCMCGKTATATCVVNDTELPSYYMYFFTAKWCGPCQTFKTVDKPIMEGEKWVFSSKLAKGVHIIEVDIDDNPELYKKIMNSLSEKLKKEFKGTIPAFAIIYKGEVIALTEHYLRWENLRDFYNNNAKGK